MTDRRQNPLDKKPTEPVYKTLDVSKESLSKPISTPEKKPTNLVALMGQLSSMPVPWQDPLTKVTTWFASLTPQEQDIVLTIGQAVCSLSHQEKQILYAGCSEDERKVIGLCCVIFEA